MPPAGECNKVLRPYQVDYLFPITHSGSLKRALHYLIHYTLSCMLVDVRLFHYFVQSHSQMSSMKVTDSHTRHLRMTVQNNEIDEHPQAYTIMKSSLK